ncbi:MAG TPA: DUF2599 domain-containing protein [Cellulomonas sp.]
MPHRTTPSHRTTGTRSTPPRHRGLRAQRGLLPAVGLAAAVLALAGCGLIGSSSAASGTGTATADATATGTAGSSATTADAVRARGTALTVGDLTVQVLVADGAPQPTSAVDEDGATTLTVTTGADGTALLIAPPPGVTVEELADGTVVLRADGTFTAGITATALDGAFTPASAVQDDGLVVWSGDAGTGVAVTIATAAVRSATWADRDDEGGLSLAVVPTTWARTGGLAADEGVWAQLIALEPDADTQAMHDQLTCHTIGAPDKDSWNLEPWRPDVGLLATIAALCNPSD